MKPARSQLAFSLHLYFLEWAFDSLKKTSLTSAILPMGSKLIISLSHPNTLNRTLKICTCLVRVTIWSYYWNPGSSSTSPSSICYNVRKLDWKSFGAETFPLICSVKHLGQLSVIQKINRVPIATLTQFCCASCNILQNIFNVKSQGAVIT